MSEKKSSTKKSSAKPKKTKVEQKSAEAKEILSQAKSIAKTSSPKVIILMLVFLLIGVVIGTVAFKIVTKNDVFKLIGVEQKTLNVGDDYKEEGVLIIAYGKDISTEVIISGEVDTSKAGEYTLTYSVDRVRYGNVSVTRKVVVITEELTEGEDKDLFKENTDGED